MEKQKKGLPKRDEAREPMDLTGGLGAEGDELIILEARYGWTQDLWNAKQLATTALSGFKDVTAILQADVSNKELRLDPKEDPTWYEKHFDFGIRLAFGGVRRLGIRYKFGKEGAEEVFMSKTRHKRHCAHAAGAGYVGKCTARLYWPGSVGCFSDSHLERGDFLERVCRE